MARLTTHCCDPVRHPKWNAKAYIVKGRKKHPLIYGENNEETRKSTSITPRLLRPINIGRKNFQCHHHSVILIDDANRSAFVCAQQHLNNILILYEISRKDEYAHYELLSGFRKISYLLLLQNQT